MVDLARPDPEVYVRFFFHCVNRFLMAPLYHRVRVVSQAQMVYHIVGGLVPQTRTS
jgi:hypothetical protein